MKTISKILFGIAAACVTAYLILSTVQWNAMRHSINSAPAWTPFLVNTFLLLFPACIAVTVALYVSRKTALLVFAAVLSGASALGALILEFSPSAFLGSAAIAVLPNLIVCGLSAVFAVILKKGSMDK